MPPHFGTRSIQTHRQLHQPGGSIDRSLNTDHGLTKNVTASITFGSGRATGANGTFTSTFAVGDTVMIEGSVLNSGFCTVNGLDATNAAYLTLDPSPKTEGPIMVTIRTP